MAEAAQLTNISQWVTFKLGEETYGVNVMQVQEVLRVSEIAPVPGAPIVQINLHDPDGNHIHVDFSDEDANLD